MSHRSYRVHPDARRDLKGIIARLVIDRNAEAATAFVEAARQTFIGIGKSPALGSPVGSHNLRLSGLRKRAIPGFAHALVFYRFSVVISDLKDANVAMAQRLAILEFHLQSRHEGQ